MNKCLVTILLVLGLSSCTTKDEQYYRSHPNALQQAIRSCPTSSSQGLSCEQLETLARRMNNLAYELQRGPQQFGAKILALQEIIATQQQQLQAADTDSVLQAKIEQNKHDLADYMAVVKWLESPVS